MRPDTTFTGPDLCRLPAREVVRKLKTGDITPLDLVDASAARIAQVEPDVNAVVTACPDRARARAGQLAPETDTPGWLGGLPIGVKDLNLVAGVRSTFGNLALKDNIPDTTDPLIERLEARGALVMGKTNTPEFGAGGNSTNAVFGSTRNPWDTRMNAGGSSGGAAVSLKHIHRIKQKIIDYAMVILSRIPPWREPLEYAHCIHVFIRNRAQNLALKSITDDLFTANTERLYCVLRYNREDSQQHDAVIRFLEHLHEIIQNEYVGLRSQIIH